MPKLGGGCVSGWVRYWNSGILWGSIYRKMKRAMMPITMVWMIRIQLEREKRDIVAVVCVVGVCCWYCGCYVAEVVVKLD